MPDADRSPEQLKRDAQSKLDAAMRRRPLVESLIAEWATVRENNHFAESFRIALGGKP